MAGRVMVECWSSSARRSPRFALLSGLGLALAACQDAHFQKNPPYPAGHPDAG